MAVTYTAGTDLITVSTDTYTLDQINTAIADDTHWQKLGELHYCKANLLITSSGKIIDSNSALQVGASGATKNFQTSAGTSFEMTGCFLRFYCTAQITSYGTWKFENCSIYKRGGNIGLYMRGDQDHKRSEFDTDLWYNRDGTVSYYKCLMQNTSQFYYYTSGTIDDFRVTGPVMTYYADPTFKNTTMVGSYSFGSAQHATFINSTWGSLSFAYAANYLLDKWEFNIKVTDANGDIVVGAIVELKDKNGDVKHTGTTGADGKLPSTWEVLANRYDGTSETKTEYNPFTLKVTNGADETEYKITIDHIVKEDVVLIPQSAASYDDIMAGINDIKGTDFVKDTHSLKPILDDVTGLNGSAMIGTNNANTTTPPTTGEIKTELEGVGTKITSIKDKTDNLPASPAPANEYDTGIGYIPSNLVDVPTATELNSAHGSGSWEGATVAPTVGEIRTEMEGAGTKLTNIKNQADKLNFTGDDIKATLDSEKVTLTNATESQIDDINNSLTIQSGTITDASPTKTKLNTDLTEDIDDYWNGSALRFTSGQNTGIIRKVKDYTSATKQIELRTSLPYTPANGDAFNIIPSGTGADPLAIADAIWDKTLASHLSNGSTGKKLDTIKLGRGHSTIVEADPVWSKKELAKLYGELKSLKKATPKTSPETPQYENLISILKHLTEATIKMKKTLSDGLPPDNSKELQELLKTQAQAQKDFKELASIILDSLDPEILEDYIKDKDGNEENSDKEA